MKFEPIPLPREDSEPNQRSGDRRVFEVIADIKIGFGDWQKARLLDVSASGFRLGWVPRGANGTQIRIRMPGLELLSATIRWRDNQSIGCQFDRGLSIYVLDHMAALAAR